MQRSAYFESIQLPVSIHFCPVAISFPVLIVIKRFSLFGMPSTTKPWGFSLNGHHVCLNIFILGRQMTISPVFLGAEPNVCWLIYPIDDV